MVLIVCICDPINSSKGEEGSVSKVPTAAPTPIPTAAPTAEPTPVPTAVPTCSRLCSDSSVTGDKGSAEMPPPPPAEEDVDLMDEESTAFRGALALAAFMIVETLRAH